MHALKLRKIGSSVGVILPKEILERLHLREGDKLYVDENRNGVQLSPYDPGFEDVSPFVYDGHPLGALLTVSIS